MPPTGVVSDWLCYYLQWCAVKQQMHKHLTETVVVGKSLKFPQSKGGVALNLLNLTIVNGKYICTYNVLHMFMYYLKFTNPIFQKVLSFQPYISPGFERFNSHG